MMRMDIMQVDPILSLTSLSELIPHQSIHWNFLKHLGFTAKSSESPYYGRKTTRGYIIVGFYARRVTYLRSPTEYPLRRKATVTKRGAAFPKSVASSSTTTH